MANLPESSTFDAGVYQLETTDPVIGGPSGISNTPLKNLANRTLWLKNAIASLTTAIADTYAPKASPAFTGNPTAPTPAQFDNDTSLATTEFVRRALGSNASTTSYSANATLTAADVGKLVVCSASGGFTLTLPAASAVQDGGAIEIFNGAGSAITVQRAGTNTIWVDTNGYTKTSMTVGSGDTLRVISNGSSGWILADCSVAATYSALFSASFVQNGYQKMPSGLIIQWGQVTPNATGGATAFSFPIAFPNNCLSMACTLATLTGSGQQTTDVVLANNSNNTTFVAYSYNANGFAQNARALKYIAVGY